MRRKVGSEFTPEKFCRSFWLEEAAFEARTRQGSNGYLGSSDRYWAKDSWYCTWVESSANIRCHNVDVAAVGEFYESIFRCKEPSVIIVAMNSVDRVLMDVEMRMKNPSQFRSPTSIRQFFIYLLNPLFNDPGYHSIFRRLCNAVAHLPSDSRDLLSMWLSFLPTDLLEGILSRLQQFITLQTFQMNYDAIDTHPAVLAGVDVAIATLEVVYNSNGLKIDEEMVRRAAKASESTATIAYRHLEDEGRPFLLPSAFYNDAVNSEFNIRADYRRWQRVRSKDRSNVQALQDDKKIGSISFSRYAGSLWRNACFFPPSYLEEDVAGD